MLIKAMGKIKYADKTKVMFNDKDTVADIEARMQVVLERDVIPIVKIWDQYKKDNPYYLREGPNHNTPKPFEYE